MTLRLRPETPDWWRFLDDQSLWPGGKFNTALRLEITGQDLQLYNDHSFWEKSCLQNIRHFKKNLERLLIKSKVSLSSCLIYDKGMVDIFMFSKSHGSQVGLVQSVTFVLISIRMNIRIYLYQENDTNEYPNTYDRIKRNDDTNEYLYWKWYEYSNIQIFVTL